MGTWRWFSTEYCDAKSSCVVVDAWLQLFLCVTTLLFVLLLTAACCLSARRRPSDGLTAASSSSSFSSRVPFVSLLLWGSHAGPRSLKTAPMPLAVIQKDADEAHITSHKNSLKQASDFMRQTQRISRTDFATKDKDARTSESHNANGPRRSSAPTSTTRSQSFLGRISGSFSMRRSSKGTESVVPRRGSQEPRRDDVPLRKGSSPLPSLEMDAVLSIAAGMSVTSGRDDHDHDHDHDDTGPTADNVATNDNDDDATRRPSTTQSGGGFDRNASFRKRLTNVLTPHFLRGLHQPRSNTPQSPRGHNTATPDATLPPHPNKKGGQRERSATTFDEPSYRTRQKLAALPLEHRQKKERRGSVELRDKRRLSVGREAQIHFEVSDGNEASVYEVKLKEITLVKRLAFGPLSEVYAAIWRDTKVGVKLLMPREGVTDKLEEAVKNFRREIWIMGALKHPNICKLIGASLTPTCYVLVMEYMSNGSLYEYLRDEANFFPQQMVLTTALDIADGMRHIHASGVLQRDLKSKNCLVSENLVVKVADFGLSRFVAPSGSEQYTFVGTPFWAAPEVIRHEPYDEKADVYSYAIVLWELVERKDPYETINAFQVPLQVANDGLRPADFSRSAPLGLEQLMRQCWDANPDQRPSFDDIAETLQKWLAPASGTPGDVTSEPSGGGDDLSAHVQRERGGANEAQLNRFASSHDANAKAIPIVLSRGKTDQSLGSRHHQQRRSSAVAMVTVLPPRSHSERSISRISNNSAP